MARKKTKCDNCPTWTIHPRINKQGRILCWKCWQKNQHRIGYSENGRKPITLKEALAKTYYVKEYINKKGNRYSMLSLPVILANRPFKIVLVDKDREEVGK